MKKVLSLLTLVFTLNVQAQKVYKFPKTFNEFYNFKPNEGFSKLMSTPEAKKDEERYQDFAVSYIFNEQYNFDNNQVYMDWDEVEVYFLKIMNKVLPKTADRKNLDLFISRSLSENAGTSRFGNIFFNMGMICNSENEAFIAAILAHEAGHYFFNHSQKQVEEFGMVNGGLYLASDYARYAAQERRYEQQADSFAIVCLMDANINLDPLLTYHEENDVMSQVHQYSLSFRNMLKASSLSSEGYKERRRKVYDPFASHPSAIERYGLVKTATKTKNYQGANFFIDSTFFMRLKKLVREERKKIALETSQLSNCINYSLIDYMYQPKNIKNIYFLTEAIRRKLYCNKTILDKGFLAEGIDDDDLYYNNQSVLHKPEYIFNSFNEYKELQTHPFLSRNKKPFETYEQAFLFFTQQALNLNFNEANFTRALYYQSLSKKDSMLKYLNIYINTGAGLNTDLAKALLNNEKLFPNKGKMFMVYNDLSNYTKYEYNYYRTLQRKKSNPELRKKFDIDSTKLDLVIVNELLGQAPYQLYEMKNLMSALFYLYDEKDVEACKKIRLSSNFAGEDREIPESSKKNLMLFAPEWYSWFKEKNFNKLFFVDVIYQYKKSVMGDETYNNYTGYYLDFNIERPYFRDAVRSGFKLKQKESEMYEELNAFLYN